MTDPIDIIANAIRAADLPEGSVVAKGTRICYRTPSRGHYPWDVVDFSHHLVTNVDNDHIDWFLDGGATVLRHGYGEEQP